MAPTDRVLDVDAMNSEVIGALERGRGLLTTNQAFACGVSPREVHRLVRSGAWIAVRRGVYTPRERWEQLDEWRGRPLFRARAAHLTMVEEHVMSHDSAALELDLPTLRPPNDLVHITRPDVRGSRTAYGVKHHGAVYRPDQVVEVDGIQILDRARTAVDIAREHGLPHGVVACDSALRGGATRRDLERAYASMTSWPRVRTVRKAVELADSGAHTVGESMARLLVLELGIGRPQTQFYFDDGARWASCDLRVGRHLFEFDGRKKYQRKQDGGLADDDDPGAVVWREKVRQDWLCSYRLGMSRIIWSDFWGSARDRARRRLAGEYAATVARYGTDITDLAPYTRRAVS